jgi:hypothetical protein
VSELLRQRRIFARPRVENRTDGSPEGTVVSPKLHFKATPAAIKEDRAFQPRPLPVLQLRQAVPGNEQIVRPLYSKHLHSDQYWRDYDRVHAVYANAVHALQPRQRVGMFIDEARIQTHFRDRTA